MKKFFGFFLILSILSLTALQSCKKKKEVSHEEMVAKFRSQLTSNDTTQMLKLCDDAMELLKNKQIDQVLASLNEYDDSLHQVKPLSEELKGKYHNIFTMFPVLSYDREYYSFQLEGCNDVKYKVTFAESAPGDPNPPTTAYMFNPVKIDGQWKLCVKTLKDRVDMSKR